jgi:tetratricopeptide (TPR) repeat protein
VSAAVNNAIDNKDLTDEFLNHYQSLNPDFWKVYYLAGKYYFSRKDYSKAKTEFEKALTKEITTVPDKKEIEKYLKKTVNKLK